MNLSRKIIHCDCDCFYASIEMRDNPDLAGKPIAVGGSPSRRGVIATCNYIAREFGIHSAMASATARKKCPDLIIVRPDMEKYRLASQQIHQIFKKYTSIVEPLSLDEAYLDVTDCHLLDGSATKIAEAIRDEVRSTIKITISAGIAPNKFLAKVASDWNKPDGQFLILPEDIEEFVSALPVKKLPGVGKVTSSRLKNIGIETCADVRQFDEEKLKTKFGSFAERLIRLSKGVDNRAVETERIRKSVSVENTYAADLPDLRSCINELPDLYVQLSKRLDRLDKDYQIHKQFIKIKFHDFIHTTVEMISDSTDMQNYTSLCEQGFERGDKPVRLLGMGVRVIPQSEKDEGTETENEEQLSFSLDH
jgi:DNA polymerase IV